VIQDGANEDKVANAAPTRERVLSDIGAAAGPASDEPTSPEHPPVRVNPRVLVLGTERFDSVPGGVARYVMDYAPALVQQGIDTSCVLLGSAEGARAGHLRASSSGVAIWRRLWSFYREARAQSGTIDLVDVHFALYGAIPVLLGPLRRTPCVVHFHGPWAAESEAATSKGVRPAVKRIIERAIYRRATVAIVESRSFGGRLTRDYGINERRIEVIPPGVDLNRFTPGERLGIRKMHGIPASVFVVLCARRLERRMGIDVLLKAWATIQREIPGSILFVAGEGRERERIASLVSCLPRPRDVRLLGRVTDAELVSLYRMADCSVVPTRMLEGFGLVVLESLACGTPAIVTDSDGLPEGVAELDTSLIVPAGNEEALADRMLQAACGQLPSRRDCRKHAERFCWEGIAQRHAEIYRSMLAYSGLSSSRTKELIP